MRVEIGDIFYFKNPFHSWAGVAVSMDKGVFYDNQQFSVWYDLGYFAEAEDEGKFSKGIKTGFMTPNSVVKIGSILDLGIILVETGEKTFDNDRRGWSAIEVDIKDESYE